MGSRWMPPRNEPSAGELDAQYRFDELRWSGVHGLSWRSRLDGVGEGRGREDLQEVFALVSFRRVFRCICQRTRS